MFSIPCLSNRLFCLGCTDSLIILRNVHPLVRWGWRMVTPSTHPLVRRVSETCQSQFTAFRWPIHLISRSEPYPPNKVWIGIRTVLAYCLTPANQGTCKGSSVMEMKMSFDDAAAYYNDSCCTTILISVCIHTIIFIILWAGSEMWNLLLTLSSFSILWKCEKSSLELFIIFTDQKIICRVIPKLARGRDQRSPRLVMLVAPHLIPLRPHAAGWNPKRTA